MPDRATRSGKTGRDMPAGSTSAIPARRGSNAERHARSRAALLRTARLVFARNGFAPARTVDVVDGTGLTRGALYYHFPDKLALFDAVVEQVAANIAARIDAAAQPAPTALEALRWGCEEWFDAMADPQLRRIYLVDGPAALGLPRWREIDNAHGGGSLRDGIHAVIAERGDPDLHVEPLAALLSGALNEAALWIADAADPVPARRLVTASVETLLDRLFTVSEVTITLRDLPNIGATLSRRLAEIGITDQTALVAVGATEAYRLLCAHHGRRLPVCYYLYSLHGAITGRDWKDLTHDEKQRLRSAAGL